MTPPVPTPEEIAERAVAIREEWARELPKSHQQDKQRRRKIYTRRVFKRPSWMRR